MHHDGNLTIDQQSFVSHLECAHTGERHAADEIHNLSRAGKPLLVRYDLAGVRKSLSKPTLERRPPDLWRYRELLPVRSTQHIVSLGEAITPLVRLSKVAAALGGDEVLVKDEGRLPTGSFKARGLAVAVSMAKAAEQLDWRLPDLIFYPTGGGTGLIGMWKAFTELGEIGFIDAERLRMVAVQATGCAPIVRAFEAGAEHAPRWENAHTLASGIRVPQAIGDFLILRVVRESGGFAIAVSDQMIAAAIDEVARTEGLLMCPEGAATYAAYKQCLADGRVGRQERAVLFNCASGLKYLLPPVHRTLDRAKAIDFASL
jgi:threonine synthase